MVPDRIISAQARLVPSRDEIGADELALDRHHVAHQPDVEPQVVGEAAQQRHRRVRVGVDEARHDHAPAAVDRLGRFVLVPDLADGENRACAIATDPDAYTVNCSSIVRTCALVSRRSQGVRVIGELSVL